MVIHEHFQDHLMQYKYLFVQMILILMGWHMLEQCIVPIEFEMEVIYPTSTITHIATHE